MAKRHIFDEPFELWFSKYGGQSNIPLLVQLREEYPQGTDLWHRHTDFMELVIVLNGSADSEQSEGIIHLHEGDVVMFAQESCHRYTRIRKFRHFNILFRPELLHVFPLFFSSLPQFRLLCGTKETLPTVLHLRGPELFTAIGIMEDMHREQLNFIAGHEEEMFGGFCRLMVHILRRAAVSKEVDRAAVFRIKRTIHYMEEHCTRSLSIRDLSIFSNMSESSFRHRFRELTGFSPTDYLIRLRLRRAVLLMIHDDHRITEIALETGFCDGNYFARKFRQVFGRSPRDFRQMCQSGEIRLNEELGKLNLTGGK